MTTRRHFLQTSAALAMTAPLMGFAKDLAPVTQALADLEARVGGRLGAAFLDTATGKVIGHRLLERFGMCSTFKASLAGLILREADLGLLSLADKVPYTEDDMVPYAPVTTKNLAQGYMTVEALAEAAQVTSDNVAANLLLKLIDGPEGFTARLRTLGDETTRLDRNEPYMNLVPPGETRDTTTPEAMARTLARLTLGEALTPASREKLVHWMEITRTGRHRLRAGLPEGWRAGDKTGTGLAEGVPNMTNDIAVIWPPRRAPIVVTAYYVSPGVFDEMRPEDNAVLAEVGRLAATWSLAGGL
ncbi:MAG: class A beta-lactamase [Alphaproteobacteria bacterium]|nr:MAG: class A beta-lactamase [Alphaproteobacteria bacterium]